MDLPEQTLEEEKETEPRSLQEHVEDLVRGARGASSCLLSVMTETKNAALEAMACGLEEQREDILEANEKDIAALIEKDPDAQTSALVDRLRLTDARIQAMANGIREIAALPDPVGESSKMWERPNGMRVGRMRVPIGVIGIIYESRPNVTADAAALCLKSGNACVLRGGSESIHSNIAIATILSEAAEKHGIPAGAITFVDRPEREAVKVLLKLDQWIDVIIPRGGESLMNVIREESTIPVIKHDKGVCHIYVDANADLEMAQAVCINAKVQRPSTCNALESLLVHQNIVRTFLPNFLKAIKAAGVEVRGCPKTCELDSEVRAATEEDYGSEYLSLILTVKIVKNMEEALEHIKTYGSQHTESILTKDYGRAMRFLREVDAGTVMVNASTRLNDGYEFGLGAEIGISTTRFHARGPMGLEQLTCSKFIVMGSGQIRE